MRCWLILIGLLTILAGCSAPTPIVPPSTEPPRPTVTPLGKGNADSSAPPIIVLTHEVIVTRLALITTTPLPTANSTSVIVRQPTATTLLLGTPIANPPFAPTSAAQPPAAIAAQPVLGTISPTPAVAGNSLLTPTPFPSPTSTSLPTITPSPTSMPTSASHYAGPWTFAGPMTRSRGWHSATVLRDGRVLIVGGNTALDQDTSGVEVFDPYSDTFMPAPSLNAARHSHSATLLPDGRVLVIAGYALGWLSSAEIYNPNNGQWSMTQPLYPHGVCHTATLLNDGRVLVMGGAIRSGSAGVDDRVEIFDPFANSWQAAARHEYTEGCQTATRLLDGRVLIAGGNADPAIYDPLSNTWLPAGRLTLARNEAQAALLPNSRVLLTGGIDAQRTTVFNSVELYDPIYNTWLQVAPMTQPRYEHTATVLPDGRVLIVGGYRFIDGYESALLNTAEIYDYRGGAWSTIAPLSVGRNKHTATLLPDGRVLVIGGETSRGVMLNSVEILEP